MNSGAIALSQIISSKEKFPSFNNAIAALNAVMAPNSLVHPVTDSPPQHEVHEQRKPRLFKRGEKFWVTLEMALEGCVLESNGNLDIPSQDKCREEVKKDWPKKSDGTLVPAVEYFVEDSPKLKKRDPALQIATNKGVFDKAKDKIKDDPDKPTLQKFLLHPCGKTETNAILADTIRCIWREDIKRMAEHELKEWESESEAEPKFPSIDEPSGDKPFVRQTNIWRWDRKTEFLQGLDSEAADSILTRSVCQKRTDVNASIESIKDMFLRAIAEIYLGTRDFWSCWMQEAGVRGLVCKGEQDV